MLYHALMVEEYAVGTRSGLNLANQWWHRRVMTRAIQSIDQNLPGFSMLQSGIDDVFHVYKNIAKGTRSLDELRVLQYKGWY